MSETLDLNLHCQDWSARKILSSMLFFCPCAVVIISFWLSVV